jgi:hypothetical protein
MMFGMPILAAIDPHIPPDCTAVAHSVQSRRFRQSDHRLQLPRPTERFRLALGCTSTQSAHTHW